MLSTGVKRASARARGRLGLAGGLLLAACAPALLTRCTVRDDFEELPYFGPSEPHPSPFGSRKVVVSAPSSGGASSPELVAVVDNGCAGTQCEPGSQALSCYLHSSAARSGQQVQYYPFRLPAGASLASLESAAEGDDCLIGVAEQRQYEINVYNDTFYRTHQKNYLDTIRFEQSLGIFTSSNLSPVKVAVIDTGMAVHPDFGGPNGLPGVIHREDLRGPESQSAANCPAYSNEAPNHPHGTLVGGIIGATPNNSQGIAGVASNVQLISLTVGNCEGRMTTSEIGNALSRAMQLGAEVVNLSLGGASDDLAVRHAIVSLLNSNAVIVAAAGNKNEDLRRRPSYPAAYSENYPGFITVAWGTQEGNLYTASAAVGSNYSPDHVKILAPGTGIHSTTFVVGQSPGYAGCSGSSCSTPIVAAAAALAVGYLKRHGIPYDERLVEFLIIKKGVNERTELTDYVKNGAVLDMEKLANILDFVRRTGTDFRPMSVSGLSVSYNESLGQPVAQFTVNWDLPATNFGARIGLFDASCGYSEPCRIQDFPLSGNRGSQTFYASRNETLPILADLFDPEFRLYLSVAIYYVITDPVTGQKKNNYGINALSRVNLRDFDMSTASSPFLGEVTNIRMDMQRVYVQGWTCVQGNNKAAPVEIIDSSGSPLVVDYVYYYPYMAPHGTPIDKYSFSHRGGPFLAKDIRMAHTGKSLYKAGTEASPLMITLCRTLTAAHGFEFAIPFATIASRNLSGTKIKVRATSPRDSGTKKFLADVRGNTEFTVPVINYQPNITSTVSLARSGGGVRVTGSVCSRSPSPVNVEFSFSEWNYRCRLKEKAGFPDFADPCSLSIHNAPLPLVHDPEFTDRDLFASYYHDRVHPSPAGTRRVVYDVDLTPDELREHRARYPVLWPNALLSVYTFPTFLAGHIAALVAKGFKEVPTGRPLANIVWGTTPITSMGPGVANEFVRYYHTRSATTIIPRSTAQLYWDYYDVGEAYTPSVVAYGFNKALGVGEYLHRTYGVEKLMREVKKYETPLGVASWVLGHYADTTGVSSGNSCPYRFDVDRQFDQLARYIPELTGIIYAYLTQGQSNPENLVIDDPYEAIAEVPIDIRFFQDGKMILHLLSDYGSSTVKVNTF